MERKIIEAVHDVRQSEINHHRGQHSAEVRFQSLINTVVLKLAHPELYQQVVAVVSEGVTFTEDGFPVVDGPNHPLTCS